MPIRRRQGFPAQGRLSLERLGTGERLRAWWATLRLLLIAGLACLVLTQMGLAWSTWRDAASGTRGPFPTIADTPFLGIHTDLQHDSAGEQRQAAAQLAQHGLEWARIRLAWDAIEPMPGTFTWQATDTLITALVEAGLAPVLLLDGSPAWARADVDRATLDGRYAPPADPADFAHFAGAVAQRYGDRVRFYQVWDQPNIAPHWGARHIEPIAYAQLLKPAAAAIRAADADAMILAAALAPTLDRGHLALDEVSFLRRLYAAGAAASFDAVALQPFGFGATPDDSHHLVQRLIFQRARYVRQAMLDAGDAATPVWLVRMGWNTRTDSAWGTVTPAHQQAYTLAALDIAYRDWPWVAALGWAVDQPDAPPSDPWWGFALDAGLADALHGWQAARPARPQTPAPPPTAPVTGLGWLAALLLLGWRGIAAGRLLPWRDLRSNYLARPAWQRGAAWAALLAVYYLATWPPLILACWGIAALLIAAQPRVGLGLALALLPLHSYHKEVAWAGPPLTVPPAQAALLCLLPWVATKIHAARLQPRLDRWDLLALAWLGMALAAAPTVWHWPAYAQGVLDLTVIPVVLFFLVRRAYQTPENVRGLAVALAVGGLLAAGLGLAEWLGGGGTSVDGLRRLVGPTFSPNHTALYLLRSLFIIGGLAWMAQGRVRAGWLLGGGMTLLALLLTGSRGALVLGLPAGAAFMLAHTGVTRRLSRRGRWIAAGTVALLAVAVAATLGERLLNLTTVGARWETWHNTWALIQDYPFTGVGPGGFTWHYPAYLPPGYPSEPNLRHPHQFWLEMANSGGLLTLGWLTAAVALVFRAGYARRTPHSALAIGLMAGLVAGFAHAQVDAFQALPDLAAWNWAAAALLLVTQKQAAAPKDSGSSAT